MGAYLIDHPPRVTQFRSRSRRPTGLIVLHTAESVMDTIGPDTGAESVAEFIRNRTTYGSYHTLCDSDTRINLVPFSLAAFQDGTGSNEYALAISFACRTSDWARMTAAKRKGFLHQGAQAFREMQTWLKANGYPETPLRLVTKSQSDAGAAGFIYHGHRDPGRRSDPGVAPPHVFPLGEFLAVIREVMGGEPAPVPVPDPEATEMMLIRNSRGTVVLLADFGVWVPDSTSHRGLQSAGLKTAQVADAFFDQMVALANRDENDLAAIKAHIAHIDKVLGEWAIRAQSPPS